MSLKYEDKDGDFIILASQNDLDDLFMFSESDTVNAIVTEAITLPNLQIRGMNNNNNKQLPPASYALFSSMNSTSTSTSMTPREWNQSITTNNARHSSSLPQTLTQSLSRPLLGRVDRFPNISESSASKQQQQGVFNIRWKKGEMLGQGAFGVVYLGLNIDTGELMAVKQMATEEVSKRELSSLENEITVLRNLSDPNIVRYIGTELSAESLSIFLEYVPGGSLKSLVSLVVVVVVVVVEVVILVVIIVVVAVVVVVVVVVVHLLVCYCLSVCQSDSCLLGCCSPYRLISSDSLKSRSQSRILASY